MRLLLKFKTVIALALIVLVAGVLYFYKLDKIPSGFYVDEASVAYNARSILETGKDEYGFNSPIYFRLMGSYSPSLFIYLSSFVIRLFGSSPIVFRSITVLITLVGVTVFYFFARELNLFKSKLSYFVITFFYAISPWVVFNARLGYETTFGFVLFNIGAYLLYKAISKGRFLIWSVVFLSLSTYTSHNERFLAPLFLITFAIVFRDAIFKIKNKKNLIAFFVVGFLLQIPNLLMITTSAFWIKNVQLNFGYFWNFLDYLSPKNIFWKTPDIDLQHTVPRLSIMYDWMVVPYFVGLYLLVKRFKEQGSKFTVVYSVITLVPAVFSGYFLSTQRAFVFAVPLTIIIGLGLDKVITSIKSNLLRFFAISLLVFYSLVTLISSYFALFPKERANAWNYGYDQVATYIKNNPDKTFLFDSARNPRAYILLLYFLNIPPSQYQKEVDPYFRQNYYEAPPPADIYKFSNVEVRQIDWKNDPVRDLYIIGDNLSISADQARLHNLSKVLEMKNEWGETIFAVYKTNPAS